jgi:hypothetical protein
LTTGWRAAVGARRTSSRTAHQIPQAPLLGLSGATKRSSPAPYSLTSLINLALPVEYDEESEALGTDDPLSDKLFDHAWRGRNIVGDEESAVRMALGSGRTRS